LQKLSTIFSTRAHTEATAGTGWRWFRQKSGRLVRGFGVKEPWREAKIRSNISLGELCSGNRRRVVVEARGSIFWIAVRGLGYSGADVGRFLGVTNPCVTRFVATGAKPDVDELIRNL
jgi:hypothetical protein